MELWKELLICGLQDENFEFNYMSDNVLKQMIEVESYKILMQIKKLIDDDNFSDKDCFMKIEEILNVLGENNILCNRHDFGWSF